MTENENGAAIARQPRNAGNSVLLRMAQRYGMDPATFQKTVAKTIMPAKCTVTNEHLAVFLLVADRYDLDPFRKQIYAFPAKDGGITPIVGIDGWYAIMNDHPQHDGIEYEDAEDGNGNLLSVTARIWRRDRTHCTTATEYMVECRRKTEPWTKWPRRMLRHKATIQCARAAYGISGIYDPDEGERVREVDALVTASPSGGQARGAAGLANRIAAAHEPVPEDAGLEEPDATPSELPDVEMVDFGGVPYGAAGLRHRLLPAYHEGMKASDDAEPPYSVGDVRSFAWCAGVERGPFDLEAILAKGAEAGAKVIVEESAA